MAIAKIVTRFNVAAVATKHLRRYSKLLCGSILTPVSSPASDRPYHTPLNRSAGHRCAVAGVRWSSVYKSPLPDVEIPSNIRWFDYLLKDTKHFTDLPAFVFPDHKVTQTFGDLEKLVRKIGSGLLRHRFQPGDVLCVVLDNCPQFFPAIFACTNIGGIVTTCNPAAKPDELTKQMIDSNTSFVLTSTAHVTAVRKAVLSTNSLKRILVVGNAPSDCVPFSKLESDDGAEYRTVPTSDADVALLPYSSGTTGLPKGVMLTHKNLIASATQAKSFSDLTKGDLFLTFLPSYHAAGLILAPSMGFLCGAGAVIMANYDDKLFLQYLSKYKCVQTDATPPVCSFLAETNLVKNYDLTNLRTIFCGVSPLPAQLQETVMTRIGVDVRQAYGMTELSSLVSFSKKGNVVLGSSGYIVPNTKVKIMNTETRQSQTRGQPGEIVVKGPQVMKGYLNNKAATAETLVDDWLYTGDVGYIDDNDHLFVVDRVKEIIKYGSFQVAPADLEVVLMTHPAIGDCAVVGVADDDHGELPRAFVVLKSGCTLTKREVEKFVEDSTAPHEHLRGGVQFIDSIPRAQSGKILRRVLKNLIV